jgi:hypothetical protein
MIDKPELKVVTSEEDRLAKFRLDPSRIEAAVVKIPLTLQCRKPQKHEFVRVHPTYAIDVGAVELKDDSDAGLYMVIDETAALLGELVKPYCLRPYITRTSVLRIWPIRIPDPNKTPNEWHRTAAIAASIAMKKWVRVSSNRSLGAYEVVEAVNQPPDPEWPEMTLGEMINVAFEAQGRVIDSVDHPVLKMLQCRS